MTAALGEALALAQRGFRVLPLWPNSKRPALRNWTERATASEAQIRRWAETFPGPKANFGICTTGYVVLDVDVKNGKPGLQSLDMVRLMYGDTPRTFTQETPTGGRHVFFNARGLDVSGIVEGFAPGIDLRAWHNQVVAAGSTIDGKPYRVLDDSPVADAPDWLLDACRTSRVRTPTKDRQPPAVELDLPANVQRVIAYLEQREPAIEGASGDQHTFATACAVRDLGVSEPVALDLMLEYFNDRCAPPWDPEALETKVRNAYSYAQNAAAGSKTARADFADMPLPPQPAPTASELDIFAVPAAGVPRVGPIVLQWDDEDDQPEPEPLIDGLFGQGETILVYGAPGVGKSFVVQRACHAIASGTQFAGRDVEQGAVLYVVAEGHSGIRKRRKALRKKLGGQGLPLDFMVAHLNLAKRPGDRAAVRAAADRLVERTGHRLMLIVYDTMSATSPGMDENAAGEVSAAIEAVRAIAAGTGAASLVIHHEGKARGTGPRGSSAFTGNVDVQIHVSEGLIESDKEREASKMAPLRFDLEPVQVGETRKGRPVTSCVARVYSAAESDFRDVVMSDKERAARDVLRDLCLAAADDEGAPGWAPVDAWRRAYAAEHMGVAGKPLTNAQRQAWREVRTGLRDKGWTRENNSDQAQPVEK